MTSNSNEGTFTSEEKIEWKMKEACKLTGVDIKRSDLQGDEIYDEDGDQVVGSSQHHLDQQREGFTGLIDVAFYDGKTRGHGDNADYCNHQQRRNQSDLSAVVRYHQISDSEH